MVERPGPDTEEGPVPTPDAPKLPQVVTGPTQIGTIVRIERECDGERIRWAVRLEVAVVREELREFF